MFSPGPSEVGPEGEEVACEVPLGVPVGRGRGEGLPEHVLQVVSVVRPHPAGVGFPWTHHQAGLREQVGEGAAGPGCGQLPGGRGGVDGLCKVPGWGFWIGLCLWVPYANNKYY